MSKIAALLFMIVLTGVCSCGGDVRLRNGTSQTERTRPADQTPRQQQTVQLYNAPPAPVPEAQPAPPPTPATSKPAASVSDDDALDMAIVEASDYLNAKIPPGDKVAFVSARKTFPALSEYIIDGLIESAVNDKVFLVVDRAQLDAIRAEIKFQMSGEVNDSTVRSIGRILGAKTIVTVTVSQVGNVYRFGIRALEVESAQILGQINRNIPQGTTIDALSAAQPAATAAIPAPSPAAEQAQANVGSQVLAQAPVAAAGTVTPSGNTLAEQLAYIENQAGKGTVYEIVVNRDLELKPTTISTMGKDITVIIRSAGPKNIRTIQLDPDRKGSLFSIAANITFKLQDIVLKGHKSNEAPLVTVGNKAVLILNSGAKITGNTNTYWSGGVHVNGGTLELNKGAEITGNTGGNGGGIYADENGVINIRGGSITDNTAQWGGAGSIRCIGGGILAINSTVTISDGLISKNISTYGSGGGIYAREKSTVTMTGGIISGNSAPYDGGGVFVSNASSFVKKAAEGSDVSGVIYGATGQNANTAGRNGRAVYYSLGANGKNRNTTLSAYDEISTESVKGWE